MKQRIRWMLAYADDMRAIARQIWHMGVVKRHYAAAWMMLRLFPTLVTLRRAKAKPEPISPFVYAMQ